MTDQLQSNIAFTIVPDEIIRSEELSGHAKLVYMVIATHVTKDRPTAWPGRERIQRLAGFKKQVTDSAVKELEEAGWIAVKRTRGKANVYTVSQTSPRDGLHQSARRTTTSPPDGPEEDTLKKNKEGEGESVATKPEVSASPSQSSLPVTQRIRAEYSKKYDVTLGFRDEDLATTKTLVEKHGSENYLAAWKTYLADNGKNDALLNKRHPILWFHRQIEEWLEKAAATIEQERREQERRTREAEKRRKAIWWVGAFLYAKAISDRARRATQKAMLANLDDPTSQLAHSLWISNKDEPTEYVLNLLKSHKSDYQAIVDEWLPRTPAEIPSLSAMVRQKMGVTAENVA